MSVLVRRLKRSISARLSMGESTFLHLFPLSLLFSLLLLLDIQVSTSASLSAVTSPFPLLSETELPRVKKHRVTLLNTPKKKHIQANVWFNIKCVLGLFVTHKNVTVNMQASARVQLRISRAKKRPETSFCGLIMWPGLTSAV